jgi:hypothetical protein
MVAHGKTPSDFAGNVVPPRRSPPQAGDGGIGSPAGEYGRNPHAGRGGTHRSQQIEAIAT